ncbi:MAG: hypothetical protein CFE21_14895 [Bacteroidetes bacterium B1(2017)]|nr:MAG: hypothetical protein CFE21_14895 [Bacteroidetes bacterium B1(2017)]
MKPKLLLLILFTGFCFFVRAQNFNWAYAFGSSADTAFAIGESMASDKHGNVYTLGNFTGTVDFDPSEDTCYLRSRPNQLVDGFISKTDAYGNFVWAKKLSGVNYYYNKPGLVIDSIGNIIVAWSFDWSLIYDRDTLAGKSMSDTIGSTSGFVMKVDSLGNLLWQKKLISNRYVVPEAIVLDKLGEICIAGAFSGAADFNPSADTFILNSVNFKRASFVLKLTAQGEFKWAKGFSGTFDQEAKSIAISASNKLVIGGWFNGKVDFDPNETSYFLESKINNSYILSLTPLGELYFAKSFEGGVNSCNSLVLDSIGNIFCTGNYKDTVDFNPDLGVVRKVSPNMNAYIAKFDSVGNYSWVKTLGGGFLGAIGETILLGDTGNVILSGEFNTSSFGPIDFDPGPGVYPVMGASKEDIFVLKLSSNGLFIWAKTIESFNNEKACGMAKDAYGNILLTGQFTSNVDFDPSASSFLLSGPNRDFGYVLKLGSCNLAIVKQPKNTVGVVGSNQKFSVGCNSANANYHWQINDGSGFKNITDTSHYAGVTNDTLLVKNIIYTPIAKYRCLIQEGTCKAVSYTATMPIVCDFKVIAEPKNDQVKEDSAALFVVKTNATLVAYKWQINTGAGFYDLLDTGVFTGSATDSLHISSVKFAQNGYAFRCVMIRANCTVVSAVANLFVGCNFAFSKHPVSKNVGVAQAVSFSAQVAQVAQVGVSYIWQENRGEGFKDILDTGVYAGSKTDSLIISRSLQLQNNAQYRCLAMLSNCQASSDTARLLVACRFRILVQPEPLYLRFYQKGVFKLLVSDSNVKYAWQTGRSLQVPFETVLDTNQSNILKIQNYNSGVGTQVYYRCLVSDSFCTLSTDTTTLTTCNNSSFLDQPLSQIVNKGTDVVLAVTTVAFIKNYQWQIRLADSSWADIANSATYGGATTAILTIYNFGIGLNNKVYRCKLVDGNCSIFSNPATITLYNPNGIQEQEELDASWVYPNPNTGQLTLDLAAQKLPLTYELTDLNGKIQLQGRLNQAQTQLDLHTLSSGCYFLRIGPYKPTKIIRIN